MYGNQFQVNETFYDWCIQNNKQIYIKCWNYELNEKSPKEVGSGSPNKFWFNCPEGKHEPFQRYISVLVRKAGAVFCQGCNSIGQFLIDTYGIEYFNKIWSDKNTESPFDIPKGSSKKRIWLKCLNDETHPDYLQLAFVVAKGHGCPYCSGRSICLTNSLGYNFPEAVERWSDKNELTPFDFTKCTDKVVWWKCENGKHEDYKRKISNSQAYSFQCPKCEKENHIYPKGDKCWNWKGGITPEEKIIRKSQEYVQWRNEIFSKDGYTCQCCGNYGGRLQAHHILDFASNPELRFSNKNGISMCFNCHDTTSAGSLHNTLGTHQISPEQLEEYINKKRKELGIYIPFSIEKYQDGTILKSDDVLSTSNKDINNS